MSQAQTLPRILLASGSPRRKELLSNAGVSFEVVVSGCDETPVEGESAQSMVERLATLKAQAVLDKYPSAVVLGADTTVVIDGECLGKPENDADACRMLDRIQGREHEVWGGFAILGSASSLPIVRSITTKVRMRPMTPHEIAWYVSTGEPMDKAGSYAIQGIGLQFVDVIDGSYSNVVGLDIAQVMVELRRLSFDAQLSS